jgi:hypothetical protein
MNYGSPITYCLQDMAYARVFKKWVKLQGQGQEIKKIMFPIERSCHKEYIQSALVTMATFVSNDFAIITNLPL